MHWYILQHAAIIELIGRNLCAGDFAPSGPAINGPFQMPLFGSIVIFEARLMIE